MEKRRMMTFNVEGRLVVELLASLALLFFAYRCGCGVFDGSQTQTGTYGLAVFALLFAAGGIGGLIRTLVRYKKAVKAHEIR